jgi:tetratricopeptide (TPR) repeat protein
MLAPLLVCLSAAAFGAEETPDLASLRSDAFAAYRSEDYVTASKVASRYVARARTEGRTGREFAAVAFVLGHSRYEVHRASGDIYTGDYRAEVIAPLVESLRILQDDPAFKNMLLSNAYHELWNLTGRSDLDIEGRAHWHLFESILIREAGVRDRPKDSKEYDLFARHLLFYLERCLDLVRDSGSPGMYIYRIRSLAPLGFGTVYDDRFLQIHELTYFDGGNMKAAALWQRGLDAMLDPGTGADTVLSALGEAADLTRRDRDRAEIYRQMADFTSTIDEPVRRVQAAEFSRQAYDLAPDDAEIRKQFGSALHVLSYAAFARSDFLEALRRAQESTTFDWEGMEVAYFDLSRAAAELGRETDALTHGERAYRLAKGRLDGIALQPFAQNYVNILRQFGQEGLALRILSEEAALGVR